MKNSETGNQFPAHLALYFIIKFFNMSNFLCSLRDLDIYICGLKTGMQTYDNYARQNI